MKKTTLLTLATLFLGGALTAYYWQDGSTPAPLPRAEGEAALSSPALPQGASFSDSAPAPLPSLAQLPRVSGGDSTSPQDPRMVQFEVVEDNLAVAFGDLIIGQIPEGEDVARSGRWEPPAMRLWESPEIPYVIDAAIPNPQRIEQAIAYFTEHTPVRFIPRTQEPDAIVFQTGTEHCYSSLGRIGGLQPVRLSPGCGSQEIIHELMHSLGFVHEQSRPDRDQNIQILWDNIDAKYRAQYDVVPDALMEAARGTPFDFRSAMLYRPDTFAIRKGLMTLQPLGGRPAIQPVQVGLSENDILRLKRLFKVP